MAILAGELQVRDILTAAGEMLWGAVNHIIKAIVDHHGLVMPNGNPMLRRPAMEHLQQINPRTVVKKVDFSRNDQENRPIRRPNSSRRLPTGNRARTYRTGPHSSHSAGLNPRISLSRIGSASPPIQPVLRCKRRFQLPRDRTPVRPYVPHTFPCRYAEGDMDAVANGCNPKARNAL